MIRIRLLCVGKLKESYLREACAEYEKRLSRFCKLEIAELAERPSLAEEGGEILGRVRGKTVVLAIEGKPLSSEEFADMVGGFCDRGEEFTFVIGSSCGLDPAVKARADRLVSFSRMTFPHQLFRVLFLEQLYRAFMIGAGAEYHK